MAPPELGRLYNESTAQRRQVQVNEPVDDMGANVWEWLADRRGGEALTAGGSWWYGPEAARKEGMQWKPSAFYAVYVGFRCAYD